jgi:PAS domain S-box-containing protein
MSAEPTYSELEQKVKELERECLERRRAEEAFQESNTLFRVIFEGAAIGIGLTNLDGKIVESNPALQRILGYSGDELRNLLFTEITHHDDIEAGKKMFRQLWSGEKDHIQMEYRYYRKDGSTVWGNLAGSLLRGAGGEPRFFLGLLEDITHRKHMEQQLLEYQEQLRSLASQLSLAEEHERRHIALDLHDGLAQNLALSKMKLETFLESASCKDRNDFLTQVLELIERAIEDTRSLTLDLSPPALYEMGLEAAVEMLVEQLQVQHGDQTRFTFKYNKYSGFMNEDERIIVFRAVREMLVNVVKHAHARNAKVSMGNFNGLVRIVVEDDGIGFDTSGLYSYKGGSPKFGLFSIRERLEPLGGFVEVSSRPGFGTQVTLLVPLRIDHQSRGKEIR